MSSYINMKQVMLGTDSQMSSYFMWTTGVGAITANRKYFLPTLHRFHQLIVL